MAALVHAADAISGARPAPGAKSIESYVKRLAELEEIATSKPGVERCFAMQAGREMRVMVKPSEIDDDAAVLLVAPDRARDRGQSRVPGPDQDHGDPGIAITEYAK